MTAAAADAEILRELAAAAGMKVTSAAAPGCEGALRVLRGGRATTAGDVVVLLHGRGHAATLWFPVLAPIAARRPVLAVDLPGHGDSAAPPAPGRRARPEDGVAFFVEPVEALLAADVAAGQARSFVLVGHSLGGLVALELALRRRIPVSRLVLIDAMGVGPLMTGRSRIFFRLHPERLSAALGRRLFERLNPPPPTPLGRRVADLEHALFAARTPHRRAAARAFDLLCPLIGAPYHHEADLAGVSAPVLLVWGQRDAALPVENMALAHMRLPSSELVVFPTLGHSPHLEAPEKVLTPLLRVL